MPLKTFDEDKIISEINITPLTDVTLVLLIIFMVTTPLIMQVGIKVNLPKSSISEVIEPERIIITVSKNNKIYINNSEISFESLSDSVKSKSDKIVIINADKDVSHGFVVEILDVVKKSGAKNLAIATLKK